MATGDGWSAKYRGRREAILDGALEVFARVGLDGAGLKEVASHLGLTHPALYHYFRSREELVCEAVIKAMGDLVTALDAALAGVPPHPPVELVELCRAHVAHELEGIRAAPFVNSVLYGPLGQATTLPEARREEIYRLQRHVYRTYRDVVARGQGSGDFVGGPPGPLAFGVLGCVSYTVFWFRDEGGGSVGAVAHGVATQALRSVSRRVETARPE